MRKFIALFSLVTLATVAAAEGPAVSPSPPTNIPLPPAIYPINVAVPDAIKIANVQREPKSNLQFSDFRSGTIHSQFSQTKPAETQSARQPEKTISGDYVALIPAHPTPNFRMVPSPNYRRIAMTETFPPRNRWYIAVDDRAWEFYDLVDAKSLQFSPDSKHVACAALRDGSWRIVIDNAEYPCPLPRQPSELRFNGDSSAIAYIAHGENTARAIVAGKRQPDFDSVEKLATSADGKHFAYIATRGKQTAIVTDTATYDTPEVAAPPTLTGDAKHVRWLAASMQDNRPAVALIEDGKTVSTTKLEGKLRRASISPDGQHTAIVQTADPGGHLERITIDGVDNDTHYLDITRLAWSPTNHLAFVGTLIRVVRTAGSDALTDVSIDGPRQFVVFDGRQDQQPYARIVGNLVFTDNGSQLAFQAADAPIPSEPPLVAPPRPLDQPPVPPQRFRWDLRDRTSSPAYRWNELSPGISAMAREGGSIISAYHTDTPWGDVIDIKPDGSHKTHILVASPKALNVQKDLLEVKLYAIEKEPEK